MLKIKNSIIKGEKRAYILRGVILILFAFVLMFFLRGAKFALLVICAAAVHEAGHLIFAKLLGVPLVRVKGSFFGMWLGYDFSNKSYLVQIIVSCAGAAFNVACAGIILFCTKVNYVTAFFVFSNLALALFNLMPVSRFDGIGVLRCLLLTLTHDVCRADMVCRRVSQAFSVLFFIFTVYIQMRVGINLPMLIVSVFLLYNCIGGETVSG